MNILRRRGWLSGFIILLFWETIGFHVAVAEEVFPKETTEVCLTPEIPLKFPDGKKSVTIPLKRMSDHLLVPVRINSKEAGYFILDTGDPITDIDSKVFRFLLEKKALVDPHRFSANDVVGEYEQLQVQNKWQKGTITLKPGSSPLLLWTNKAGVSWTLTPDFSRQLLLTDVSNPYQGSGGKNFILTQGSGHLTSFYFNGDFYKRVGAQVTATQ